MFFAILLTAQALSSAESLPNVLDYAVNGGIAVIVFIIWWFTFKYMIKQHEETIRKYEELVRETKKEYQQIVKENKDDHTQVVNKFIQVVEKMMEHNNWIGGLLIKFETQLTNILKFIERKEL